MNDKTLKGFFMGAAAGIAVMYGGVSFAHTQSGSLLAASGAGATDVYQVTCEDDATSGGYLEARIKDFTAGSMMSLQLVKGSKAANGTDTVPADANFGGWAKVFGGAGAYYMVVDRNGTSAANDLYTIEYHCHSSNPAYHAGTQIAPLSTGQ
ncbi:MAG TPA: hypothetical protein VI457_08685 [Methylococcaceae bacterium]|nr:hypothetical protein [Methylococcaceae bacterium]